ncbi:MAG: hypothetical protein ABTQ27_07130 [Amaricoccus sp.]|uniref:hypothetical protein n=1 Tax=Amaricoccus sp. TaxID=1872485 RepID=UPI003314E1C8
MSFHHVETCPDDLTLLAERLDQIARAGTRIINVTWQPARLGGADQAEAPDARGGFVIISQSEANAAANAVDETNEPATLVAANTPRDKITA